MRNCYVLGFGTLISNCVLYSLHLEEKQYQKKAASAAYSKHIFSPKVVGLSIWKVGSRPDSPIFKNVKSIVIGNTTAYWTENDVNYQLTDSDHGLSFEQMSKIAESIITSK